MAFDILRTAAARQALGLLLADELPGIATDALMAGFDSPALRRLAGEPAATAVPAELWETFDRVLQECGVDRPAKTAARIELLGQFVATRGALTPIDVARRIVEGLYYATDAFADDREVAGDALGIEALVGLYWDWRDLREQSAPNAVEYTALEGAMATALDQLHTKLTTAPPPHGTTPSAA